MVQDSNIGSEITSSWNGQIIKGRIVFRSKHGLKVEITSLYTGRTESTSINGLHKSSPYHFLTAYGDTRAKEMLIDCYQRMKLIEEKLPIVLALYKFMMDLVGQLGIAQEDEKTKIIKNVIWQEWGEWIFDEPEIGLILSYGQEDQLLEFIQKRFSVPRK